MRTIAIILGGGAGTRLQPLTAHRAKPAVPVGGCYRLVDIPISNCINSDLREMYLLTQFNSVSLHRHIQATYCFDQFNRGFVSLLAAEQTRDSAIWFQGTADAVRQSLHHFAQEPPDLVLILSGDQLYRLDFQKVIEHHQTTRAEVTVCSTPVAPAEAGRFGVLTCNEAGLINSYREKPSAKDLPPFVYSGSSQPHCLASMGIYLFNWQTLAHILGHWPGEDFGSQILPRAIRECFATSYIYRGYWRDIGTIGSFYEANLALTQQTPPFTFSGPEGPIYTHMRNLPPSRISDTTLKRCLIADGCRIEAAAIEDSVIGLRSVVGAGTTIRRTIVMGADTFPESSSRLSAQNPGNDPSQPVPALGIGRNCTIERAIIDKNVQIGDNVHISPANRPDQKQRHFVIQDGVLVIPKGTVIPANTTL